ncbi:MAG: PQQ-dependent sugar dehydrogenase [Gammaproteobacteria bacterium]|nr:PQQ-dependent sugar dehydrogenase [Gammaproteobacteria bacterium]
MANDPMRNTGLLAAVVFLAGLAGYADAQTTFLEEGFTLEVVTDDVPLARQIAEAPDGTLFVGSSSSCDRGPVANVYAVVPRDDGDAEVVTVDTFLRCPSGVALRGNDLYVAARDRVLRYPNIMDTFRDEPAPEVVADDLPDDNWHGWKYLVFGPDGYLYVPVGAPCNVCERSDERFSTILRMDPDSGETTVYARGVRNSVGMAWHPVTGQLWFSENGRDHSGNDLPADEINRVQTPGGHYGFPYFHQDHRTGEPIDYRDPQFGGSKSASDYLRSEHLIQAHSAALGVAFYTGDQFPSHYCGAMFIAEHGSWNRYNGRVGHQVSVLRFSDSDAPRGSGAAYASFADWLNDQTQVRTGRPNDVVVGQDGSLLIADDHRGRIYRVRYTPPDGDTAPTGCADTAHIPTFAPKSHETRQGFARVVNHGETTATIEMEAFNAAGQRHGPVTLALEAGHARHFNSADLEDGNEDKGLSGSIGAGAGDWRIELRGDGLEVLSYMRTEDGFVTSLHDTAPLLGPVTVVDHDDGERSYEYRYDVPIFNPGRNINQVSMLRLVNPGDHAADVTITGIDSQGASGENAAALTLARRASRSIPAADLESGEGLNDAQGLGTGAGKWRLVVASNQPILVAGLLASPTGHLTNLSTVPDNKTTEGMSTTHFVPLFPAHGDANDRQGFVRIINRGDNDGSVEIRVQDDTNGDFEALTLPVQANQSVHFNSEHLETGEGADWTDGIGSGQGDWRLTLSSELDLDVLAYIRRTSDGFLTSMHDFVRRTGTDTYEVAFFNPGKNTDQVSHLRILNTGAQDASVSISGTDSAGGPSTGTVVLTVPAGTARSFSSQELEAGHDDFSGALGTGTGKWRLTVTSEQPIRVMSLLENRETGHLTNLSTVAANQPWQWDR